MSPSFVSNTTRVFAKENIVSCFSYPSTTTTNTQLSRCKFNYTSRPPLPSSHRMSRVLSVSLHRAAREARGIAGAEAACTCTLARNLIGRVALNYVSGFPFFLHAARKTRHSTNEPSFFLCRFSVARTVVILTTMACNSCYRSTSASHSDTLERSTFYLKRTAAPRQNSGGTVASRHAHARARYFSKSSEGDSSAFRVFICRDRASKYFPALARVRADFSSGKRASDSSLALFDTLFCLHPSFSLASRPLILAKSASAETKRKTSGKTSSSLDDTRIFDPFAIRQPSR